MRPRSLDVVYESRRADSEDHVLPIEQTDDPFSNGRQESREQTMIFREAAAPRHRRGPHARVVDLGQLHHLAPGAVAVYSRSHNEGWALARIECGADQIQHARLGTKLGADNP